MAGRRWLCQLIERFRSDQRGNAAMFFGLCALPLAAATGLAIDSMLAYSIEDQLQKSLDAAGLAAGRTILPENVEADARSYFEHQFRLWTRAGKGRRPQDRGQRVRRSADPVGQCGDADQVHAHLRPRQRDRCGDHDRRPHDPPDGIGPGARQYRLDGPVPNFDAMQAAAKDLVNILYGSNDTNPNLYVAVVPFVSAVNIGANRRNWLVSTTAAEVCVGRHDDQPLCAQQAGRAA